MKFKQLLFKRLIIIGLCTVMPVTAEQGEQVELLPAVTQLLNVPTINEKQMAQNAYVWLQTIDGPISTNYFSVAKRVLLNNNQLLQQAIINNDASLLKQFDTPENYFGAKYQLEFVMGRYQFPCAALANNYCVVEVLKDKEQLSQLIEKNKILLARYENIIKLPNYQSYSTVSDTLFIPYHYLLFATRLRLSQAIFDIDEGRVEQGLAIIQREIDFSRNKVLTNSYFVDYAVAVRNLMVIYNVLAELLDNPQLAPYLNNPQLVGLMQPFTEKQQHSLANVFKNEQRYVLFSWNFITVEDIKESNKRSLEMGFEAPSTLYIAQAEKLGYPLKFDRNLVMNLVYQDWQRLINKAGLVLPEASKQYLIDKKFPRSMASFKQIFKKYGADNLLAGITIEQINYTDYIHRFYDLNNYLWLISAKLKIKQAGISKQQVPEFLSKLADKSKNPYSQQPFIWDAQRQMLSSDWLSEDVDTIRDGKRASVNIQFK